MSHDTSKQSVLFEDLSKKAVIAKFDQDHASSDGGAVLLKACDERLGLSATLAACLSDDREQPKITHFHCESCSTSVCSVSLAAMPIATTPLACLPIR